MVPEWHLLPLIAQVAFIFGVNWRWIVGILTCQLMLALLHIGESVIFRSLGVNAFSHPWKYQIHYVFPPMALAPAVLSKFLMEQVTGQIRLLILLAHCWMEDLLLPSVFNILEYVFHHCPIVKDLIR